MKKKIVMARLAITAFTIMTLFFMRGLEKITDVILKNYSISEDGKK